MAAKCNICYRPNERSRIVSTIPDYLSPWKRRRTGTACSRSPKGTVASPSYSTTPPANRLRSAPWSLRRPRKSAGRTRPRRLDLDARDTRGATLDDDVDFHAVLVAKVVEGHPSIVPAGLPPEFLEHERFQKLAEQGTVVGQCGTVHAEERGCDSGIAEVQLRPLDQSAQAVAVPGREAFQQKDPLEQRRVGPNCGPAHLEGRGQVAHVEQPRGLAGGGGEQPRQYFQLPNSGQITDIVLDKSVNVAVIPVGAPASRGGGSAPPDTLRRVGERFSQVWLDESGIDGRVDHRPNVTSLSTE